MKNPRLEKGKKIEKKYFRPKMETNDTTVKNKENQKKWEKRKKENKAIKNRVIEYIRNLFRMKKEN